MTAPNDTLTDISLKQSHDIYLRYRDQLPDSIWTTVARLGFEWHATAHRPAGKYGLLEDWQLKNGGATKDPVGARSSILPEWDLTHMMIFVTTRKFSHL